MKKAYRINVEKSLVEAVTIDEKNVLGSLYYLIGCNMVEIATVSNNANKPNRRLILYVDEEGLLKEPKHFFYFVAHNHPFAGNGVLVTYEGFGETEKIVDVDMPIEVARSLTSFLHRVDPGGEYEPERSVYTNVGAFHRN